VEGASVTDGSIGGLLLAIVAAICAVVGIWFRETLKLALNPKRVWRRFRAWARGSVPARGTHFAVLVADLDGDEDGQQTRHVRNAFENEQGFEVHLIGRKLAIEDLGNQTEARLAAERKGREWLAEFNGDVLIWGEVDPGGKGLHLRFLGPELSIVSATDQKVEHRPGSYELGTTGLPLSFNRDFNVVLLALVAASVAPATERQGHYLVDVLEPAAARLKHLCDNMPAGLDADQRGSLLHALGVAAYVLGEQTGERDWLDAAVAALCAALRESTRERVPLQWAVTQSNLGTVLACLGEREQDTGRLEAAVGAYLAATEVWARERFPLYWAGTQINLGTALRTLGERGEGIEQAVGRLKQAVIAFAAALAVFTRERFPLYWAMAQNNLGSALTRLGEREVGTERLEEAVAAYRAALQVWNREHFPLLWARGKNNLGVVFQTLGNRQNSTERLYEAIAAYDEALVERTRDRVPFDWAITQNNRGNALRALGELETGTEHLEDAVQAYRVALEVFRHRGASHHIGMTERNLARAEGLLAERRGRSAAE
jgi:tetratricopeptide (TPR) repeat protein